MLPGGVCSRWTPVALLGARQVGKATLARAIAGMDGSGERRPRETGLYLDLESPAEQSPTIPPGAVDRGGLRRLACAPERAAR